MFKRLGIKSKTLFSIIFISQFISAIGGFNSHFEILYSQPVQQEWVRTYTGGQNYDAINDMALDQNHNIIVTGYIRTDTQYDNFCTIKYNPSGTEQWIRTYNGPLTNGQDEAMAIAIDFSGNIYVTGFSDEEARYAYSFCTIKYSAEGSQIWVRRYSRTPHYQDGPTSIAVDRYGNVYVTGISSSCGTAYCADYLTIKYDSSGLFKWARYYNGPANNDDFAKSIAVDDSCNVYVTGWSCALQNTAGFCTIKYNINGDSLW